MTNRIVRPWRAPSALIVVVLLVLGSIGARVAPQGASGPSAYLGQRPPGSAPELFAPGVVSTGLNERDVAITPDGREVYWTVNAPGSPFTTTVVSRFENGAWTSPEVLPQMADPGAMHIEPAISPDGRHFFFTVARRSPAGRIASAEIRVMERERDGWGAPRDPGPAINGPGRQFFPSVTRDGTLYFTRERGTEADGIYRSRLVEGRYGEPQRLPPQVNGGNGRFNAFVDPDERFLIVPMEGRPDGRGGVDYYVVFRNPDDTWRDPVNLGEAVNTPGSGEYSPYVSPDGRYFFFMSSRVPDAARPQALSAAFFRDLLQRPQNGNADIYWVNAGFIAALAKR